MLELGHVQQIILSVILKQTLCFFSGHIPVRLRYARESDTFWDPLKASNDIKRWDPMVSSNADWSTLKVGGIETEKVVFFPPFFSITKPRSHFGKQTQEHYVNTQHFN